MANQLPRGHEPAALAEAAANPLQPFALQWLDPRRGLRIAAADPLARAAGVMPGISLAEANAILPSLKLLPANPEEDLLVLRQLTDAAGRFSPLVGVELTDKAVWVGRQSAQPQAILADVTKLTHFFDGPEAMVQAIGRWTFKQGYLACIAIAPSVGAAWAAANYGCPRGEVAQAMLQHRQQAEAWRIEPPPHWLDQLTRHWPEDQVRNYVDRLEVAALRLNSTTHQRLQRLGLRRIGLLSKLPRDGLASRLGKSLVNRIDSVYGQLQESIACYHAGPEFYVDMLLEFPTDRRDTIEELVRRLSDQLCQRLRQHGQGALRVLCRFSLVQETSGDIVDEAFAKAELNADAKPSKPFDALEVLQLSTFRPTAEPQHMQRLLLAQFEQQIKRKLTITAVSMQATIIGALRWEQTDLFDQAAVNLREKTAELIDVLSSRLGSEAVVCPACKSDPLPERTLEWQPLTGGSVHRSGRGNESKASLVASSKASALVALSTTRCDTTAMPWIDDPLRRPLVLFKTPVQLDVIAIHPDGPPIRFRWSGVLAQVARHWGPERIESAWWDGPTQRRDYYRVETQQGVWLWLYRDLKTRGWFVHGEYS